MSVVYGCIMGLLAFVNWNADTVAKRLIIQMLVALISLAFGSFAGRGIE